MNKAKAPTLCLSVLAMALLLTASLAGIISDDGGQPYGFDSVRGEEVEIYGGRGLYRYDNVYKAVEFRGFDWANLVVVLPLFALGIQLYRRGRVKGQLHFLSGILLWREKAWGLSPIHPSGLCRLYDLHCSQYCASAALCFVWAGRHIRFGAHDNPCSGCDRVLCGCIQTSKGLREETGVIELVGARYRVSSRAKRKDGVMNETRAELYKRYPV